MIALAWLEDSESRQEFEAYFKQKNKNFDLSFFDSSEGLYLKARELRPHCILIELGAKNSLVVFNLVRDLRHLLGMLPLIIILGSPKDSELLMHSVTTGANFFLSPPIDLMFLDSQLTRFSNQDGHFSPFKFRRVPSGGIAVQTKTQIHLNTLTNRGIWFHSKHLLAKGFIFNFQLSLGAPLENFDLTMRVISNDLSEEGHRYFAEYFELSEETRKRITYLIKTSS